MRFLYFGDRHCSPNKPENRLDDYQETCKMKDEEILYLGHKYNVSAFLQPGDFWNEIDVNGKNDFINSIMNRWGIINYNELILSLKNNKTIDKDLLDKINNYIPIVGIAGNHDLIGNSLDTLPKTTTGYLGSTGQMNLVTKDNPMYFTTEDGLIVAITGSHYHLNMDNPEYIDDYIVSEKLGDVHIHIVHGMLSEKDMGIIKHTTIDQIKDTKADITLCGHNHIGFGIIKTNNKFFVNIGSVTRNSNDIKEINRMPKVALIDISKNGIKIDEIYLKTAKKGLEVLDVTEKEISKQKKNKIIEYKKDINALKESKKSMDFIEFLNKAALKKAIPEDIKNEIVDRLTEKEIKNIQENKKATDSYITKVILENFQSHDYSEFNFENGLNVLVGESRQGKSAILRSLYWVYENKPSGKNFIKRGKDYCKVTIYLSDNTIVSRYIEHKKNGKNLYEIFYSDGRIESGNTKLLPEVQKALGYNDFKIDSKLSIPINFYKQGDSWYLIGDKLSSTDKARVIGALNGTNLADDILRDLNVENSKIITLNNISEKNKEKYKNQLKDLEYLNDLDIILKKNEILLNKYNELKEQKNKIEKLINIYNETKQKIHLNSLVLDKLKNIDDNVLKISLLKQLNMSYSMINKEKNRHDILFKNNQNCEFIISKLENLDIYLEKLNKLKQKNEIYNKLNKLNLNYLEDKNKIEKIECILSKLKNLNDISCFLEKLKEKKEIYIKIFNEHNKYELLLKKETNTRNLLSKLKSLEDVRFLIKKYNNLIIEYDELNKSFKNYQNIDNKYSSSVNELTQMNIKYNYQKKEYAKILKNTNICPICKRNIDEHIIDEIVNKGD